MPAKNKQATIRFMLILTGVILFVYGVLFHSTSVLPQKNKDSTMLILSEMALIKDVTVGGLKLDESGRIKRTYTGKPPQACPT